MAGILESMFAGGVIGAGAGMEDVYRRRDEADIRSKLEEQRAKADYDRQVALENMRQGGAAKLKTMDIEADTGRQARDQTFRAGESAKEREQQSKEKGLDREVTKQHYGVLEQHYKSQAELSRMTAAEQRRYHDETIRLREQELGLRGEKAGGKLPDHVRLRIQDIDKEQSTLDQEARALDQKRLTDPMLASDKAASARIEEGIAKLQERRMGLEMGKQKLLIENGVITAEDVVGKNSSSFKSLDDINRFIKGADKQVGAGWAKQIADEIERQGIAQRVSKNMDARSEETSQMPPVPANRSEAPPAAPAGILGRAPAAAAPAGPTGMNAIIANRMGQAYQQDQAAAAAKPPTLIDRIPTMDIEAVREILRDPTMSESAKRVANMRLRQLQAR